MSDVSFKPVGLDRDHLLALMQERKLDGLFLSSPENVFYATGYPCLPGSGNPIIHALRNQNPYFVFIGNDGQIILLCWGPAAMGIDYGVDDARMSFTSQMTTDDLVALIDEKLKPGCTVGVESTFPYYASRLLEEHAKPANIQVIDDLFYQLRMIKSLAEIELIRQSTKIIDVTLMELAQNLRIGMGRLELIREAKQRMTPEWFGWRGSCHCRLRYGQSGGRLRRTPRAGPDRHS